MTAELVAKITSRVDEVEEWLGKVTGPFPPPWRVLAPSPQDRPVAAHKIVVDKGMVASAGRDAAEVIVLAVNLLPGMIKHARDVMARHYAIRPRGTTVDLCAACYGPHMRPHADCPELASLAAMLFPEETS